MILTSILHWNYFLHPKLLVLFRKSNFLREYHLISCFLNKRIRVYKTALNINLSKNWNMNTAIIKNIYSVPRLAPSIFGILSQAKYKFELILLSKYKKNLLLLKYNLYWCREFLGYFQFQIQILTYPFMQIWKTY